MKIIDDIMKETRRLGINEPQIQTCFEYIGKSEQLKVEDLMQIHEYIPAFRVCFCQYVGVDQALLTESVWKGLISSESFLKSTLLMLRGTK